MLGGIDLHVHMQEYEQRSGRKDSVFQDRTQGEEQSGKQRKLYPMSGSVAVISIEGPMSKGGSPLLDAGCSPV
jgi:hypothetical protein